MELPSILKRCAQPELLSEGLEIVLPIRDAEPALSPLELEAARKTRTEITVCVQQGWLELSSYEETKGAAENGAEYPAARVRLKITPSGEEEVRRNPSTVKRSK